MKKINYFLVAIIIILTVLNFIKFRKVSLAGGEVYKQNKTSEMLARYKRKIVEEAIQRNTPVFKDSNFNIYDAAGSTIHWRELLKKPPTLFMAFSPVSDCTTCITETILSLKAKYHKPDDVILLVYDVKGDDLELIRQKYNLKYRVLSISDSALSEFASKAYKPFLFTLNNKSKLKSLYFVETDMNYLTNEFISLLP